MPKKVETKDLKQEAKNSSKVDPVPAEQNEKPVYIMCPRCELNYILKKDKHCTVCKASMGLIDASILIPEEEMTGDQLCPVCNVNYLAEDESTCFLCVKEREDKSSDIVSEEWEEAAKESEVEEEPEEELEIVMDDEELAEEEEEEVEDYSHLYKEPDDFDYTVDEKDFLDSEEIDEDDEEDGDFED